jgi:hypothetical protein
MISKVLDDRQGGAFLQQSGEHARMRKRIRQAKALFSRKAVQTIETRQLRDFYIPNETRKS